MTKKILLIHLVSNGDCLMATTIARQIKYDNPGCHLTWAISFKCKQVIENNPFVDSIWEITYANNESALNNSWYKVKTEAEQRKKSGEFDRIICTQIIPENLQHFDGTTRSSTFGSYISPISVPVTPVIRLYNSEIENVKAFSVKFQLHKYQHVVLCECAPGSGQSFLTPQLMLEVATVITKKRNDIIFIISTHLQLTTNNERIIDASTLSYRENAELSKYCTLLVGCSSGITWLLTSDWAKKIPTVQFLEKANSPFHFASVQYDFKHWGLSTEDLLETSQKDLPLMTAIIGDSLQDFKKAKEHYGEELYPGLKMLKNFLRVFAEYKYLPGSKYSCTYIDICKKFIQRNPIAFYQYFIILFYIPFYYYHATKIKLLYLAKKNDMVYSKILVIKNKITQ